MDLAIAYILVSVVLGAAGQILLKKGMNNMGQLTISSGNVFNLVWNIATNPYVFIGLAIYMGGTFFWLVALSRVELSFAYPFASLSYVAMLLASWLLFSESLTVMRLTGTAIVFFGVYLITLSRG
jgi:drug/metabolite transporter (DMT)-like permease